MVDPKIIYTNSLTLESSKTGLVYDKTDIDVHDIFTITEPVLSSCKRYNSLISKHSKTFWHYIVFNY